LRRVGRVLGALALAAVVVAVAVGAALALLQTGGSAADGTDHPRDATTAVTADRAEIDTGGPAQADREPVNRGKGARVWQAGAASSWARLSRSLPARVGLSAAPLGRGPQRSFGALQAGHAWSSIKVPILVALMDEREGRGLSGEEMGLARAALTASDNSAAASLFGRIEEKRGGLAPASLAVQAVLRRAGDAATTIPTDPPPPGAVSSYGQTLWSLPASVELFRALARGCLLDHADTEYVLGLMEEVTPEQRWGLGEAGFPSSWRVAIKGGWGPEGSAAGPYLVRQSGVLRKGNAGLAVSMIARAGSGSFEEGARTLDRIAAWLDENLRGLGGPKASC
jgi:beta-lactamase class A